MCDPVCFPLSFIYYLNFTAASRVLLLVLAVSSPQNNKMLVMDGVEITTGDNIGHALASD